MAEIVSPPPAIVSALALLIDVAMFLVPFSNEQSSKTPTGPFHSIVAASEINFLYIIP